jgi:hypothetical protein
MSSSLLATASHSIKAMMPRFLRRQNTNFSRRHVRHDCVVVGTMKVVEIGAEFDGVMVEISAGGCAFRPASMFMLDRSGEVVAIRTEYFEAEGRIRAVRPGNYGIQFFEDIDQEIVERVIAEHSGKIGESFLARRN